MLLLEKTQGLEAQKTQLDSDLRLLTSRLSSTEAELRASDSAAGAVPDLTAQVSFTSRLLSLVPPLLHFPFLLPALILFFPQDFLCGEVRLSEAVGE